ncbi:MAG: CRISPR-associated helicase Cas3' [Vicinamibacterales bacterium]
MDYDAFFSAATGLPGPYPYQRRLACEEWPDLLDVPTGMGKTAAVTLAWLYKRGWRPGQAREGAAPGTPRRLIWCLPMRVLVEQTERNIKAWLEHLGLLGRAGDGRVSVHVLMGGADDLRTWAEYPDEDLILIGTQDLLLSRALMRGYAMSRYQWPLHFAWLHNDAFWVFDEVQLMGAGVATSAQLDAFRRVLPLSRPSRSLWVSATLNRSWLATVDLAPHLPSLRTLTLDEQDECGAGDRLNATKHLECASLTLGADTRNRKGLEEYVTTLCETVLDAHRPDSQSLIVLNRVDRAQELYRRLKQHRPVSSDLLVHARFRSAERAEQTRRLREEPDIDRIVVATQAIEAGVDVSSRVLVTELAPWPSMVQRFGRCNRYGEHNGAGGARIVWVDASDEADMAPYDSEELAGARAKLATLTSAGPRDLPRTNEERPATAVIRRKDLLDLFNTDPDLSGFDVDVSDYIRDSGAPGVRIFWRDFVDPNHPIVEPGPDPRELCPASIGHARGLHKRGAWHWDTLERAWTRLSREPRPGMTLLLKASDGGYDPEIGFDPGSRTSVGPLAVETPPGPDYGQDARSLERRPVPLEAHLAHAAHQARVLCDALQQTSEADVVVRASRWHDVGKAHAVFQETMHRCGDAPEGLLAKSPCAGRHSRPWFRHELVSMLAWLDQHAEDPECNLVAYLIAAHHGKVRMSLRAMPTEEAPGNVLRFARGVWEGDVVGAIAFDGDCSAEVTMRLALMEIGDGDQGPSWASRTLSLLDQHGPFRLAWLESLVRLADWRASAAEQAAQDTTHA